MPDRQPVTREFDRQISECTSHIFAQRHNRHLYIRINDQRCLDINKGARKWPELFTEVFSCGFSNSNHTGYQRSFCKVTQRMTPWEFISYGTCGMCFDFTDALNQALGIQIKPDTSIRDFAMRRLHAA